MNYFGFNAREPRCHGFIIMDNSYQYWKILFDYQQKISVVCSPDNYIFYIEQSNDHQIVMRCVNQDYNYLTITPIYDKNQIIFKLTGYLLDDELNICNCRSIKLIDENTIQDIYDEFIYNKESLEAKQFYEFFNGRNFFQIK